MRVLEQSTRTVDGEEFKKLEMETEQRREYTERLLESCNGYLKTMGRKKDGRDTKLPMEGLASSMINFGSVLDENSAYGRALLRVGEAHEKIASAQVNLSGALQDGYVNHLTNIMADMKEYQRLKGKLENRRLDFDAKLNRVHKSKKENTVLEEEIRVAQNKYEETLSDTTDRMIALNSNEEEQLHGLLDFVDAEVEYFKSTLSILTKLQTDIAELRDVARSNTVNKPRNNGLGAHRNQSFSTNYDDEETTHSSHMSRSSSYNTMSERKSSYPAAKHSPTLPSRHSQSPSVIKQVRVLYDFDAEGPGELSIRSGDIINVTVEIDDGWWEGELADAPGSGGMFPSNYVEVIEDYSQGSRGPAMPSRPSAPSNPSYSPGGSNRGSFAGSSANNAPTGRTPSTTPPRPTSESVGNVAAPSYGRPSYGGASSGGGGGGGPACSVCSCTEFIENAFKPGQCRTCFH
ncbi:hypothetical protein HDU96_010078, partial [Phlyctochytrium bullatum]